MSGICSFRLNNVSQLAGVAKRDDVKYFAETIGGMGYAHIPKLAPTKEILDNYKKHKRRWSEYEERFNDLIAKRKIEEIKEFDMDGGCLLCSEDKPHNCHRGSVAEYLKEKWGGVDIIHL